MKTSDRFVIRAKCVFALAVAAAWAAAADSGSAAEKQDFKVKGLFVEGCSCSLPCPCEIVDVAKGCEGVGAMTLESGEFNGTDLSGVKLAYAVAPGSWVLLYVDAPKAEQKEAAHAFAKAYYRDWGKLESARDARIAIEGSDGAYTVTIDDGKTMKLKTEPVLGGDGKKPVVIRNTKSKLNPDTKLARTVSCTFKDGGHEFELKDSNSYFNDEMKAKGEL